MPRHPETLGRVELPLHDIEFAVHLREAAFRLHEDQPVHAVGDVMRHAWRRAVIDEHAGDKSLECHDLFLARPGLREVRSTTWTGGAVEVHRVIHEAVVVVFEMYLDRV